MCICVIYVRFGVCVQIGRECECVCYAGWRTNYRRMNVSECRMIVICNRIVKTVSWNDLSHATHLQLNITYVREPLCALVCNTPYTHCGHITCDRSSDLCFVCLCVSVRQRKHKCWYVFVWVVRIAATYTPLYTRHIRIQIHMKSAVNVMFCCVTRISWCVVGTHISSYRWCWPGKSVSHYGKYVGCGPQFRYTSEIQKQSHHIQTCNIAYVFHPSLKLRQKRHCV